MAIKFAGARVSTVMASSLPPLCITQKTVRKNCFSKHDNRHAFQTSGVYFGQGLGKRPVCRSRNQHISQDHTTWATSLPLTIPQTASTYGSDFCRGRHMTQNDTLLTHNSELQHPSQRDSSPFLSRSSFHRFPRKHKSAVPCLDPLPPLSNLAGCCPQDPQQGAAAASSTPLSVLAESQRPFLPHNPWIYSYKS